MGSWPDHRQATGGTPWWGEALPIALLAALAGCSPYAGLTEVGEVSPAASDCGSCHVEIHAEWAASAHAASWSNDSFVRQTSGRRFEACLGCHAPTSVFVEGTPPRRTGRLDEGVHCLACHFDGGVLAGPAPTSALLEPHPVATERAIYRTSELCGKCHEGTLREWTAAPVEPKKTCPECHMPAVERTLTQGTDPLSDVLVAFEDRFEGRRHTFHLDAVAGLEDAVEIRLEDARREAGRVTGTVVLVSRLPHRVPTGDFGFRRVVLSIEGTDAAGRVAGTVRFELFKETGTALEPLVPRTFAFDLPGEATSVRARLERGKLAGPAAAIAQATWRLP